MAGEEEQSNYGMGASVPREGWWGEALSDQAVGKVPKNNIEREQKGGVCSLARIYSC